VTYLGYADIAPRLGISVDLLRHWVERGKFPPPDVKTNPRNALWYESTVKAWEEHR
jgi:predicted DNA-binding transcriptional regulator AlpA